MNAVAFADGSSQLLFSGSDDALCKVWDRRTLREDRPQPVGHLAGHRDGITFIHSKVRGGAALTPSVHQLRSSLPVALLFLFENPLFCRFQGDARYLISNSKDQSIKLWDIRKFSPKEGLAASRQAVTQQNWDYRWQQVPQRGVGGGDCWGGGRGGGWRVVVSNGCLSVLSSPEEAPAGGGHLGDDLPGSRRPPHAHPLPLLPRVQHRPEVHLLRLLHGQDRQ